jgi:hypothetical protein
MKSGDYLTNPSAALIALIALLGGCYAQESPARPHATPDNPSSASDPDREEPSAATSTLDPLDPCTLPARLTDLGVCHSYAQCCGYSTEVTPSACALSIANDRAVCECSFAPANKVRCEQTASGVECRCQ